MRIAFNTIALVGLIGAVLLAPQQASATDERTCRIEYYECIASGDEPYICREQFYFCVGILVPVHGAEPIARLE